MSLCWSSRGLHPKEPLSQISHKLTKVNLIRLSRTWKKCHQISKSYALQHIKTFFPKNTRSSNAHDWGYKWVFTPIGKRLSQILLLEQKSASSQSLWQVSSLSQWHWAEEVYTPKDLPASKHWSTMNRDNKSANWNDKFDPRV